MGTAAALFAAELALRLLMPPALYVSWRSVVQDFATRAHADPRLRYVNQEGFDGPFVNREFRTRIHINSRGLREREIPYARTPGQQRVLVLGDSYAFGWGVEAEETVGRRLEERLPGVQVVNASCSGWSTAQEAAFYELEARRYQPDLVLLFFTENDPEGNLDLAGPPPASPARPVLRTLARHSALWVMLRAAKNAALAGPGPAEEEVWPTAARLLGGLQDEVAATGAHLALVYVPARDADGHALHGGWFDRLAAHCRARAVPLLDLVPALEGAAESAYFRLDDHWTPAGHAAAAAATADFIRRQQLLPPAPMP